MERTRRDAERIREKCKSLYGFIEEFWSVLEPDQPFVGGWAIKALCQHLEAVTNEEIQYLLVTVPPGTMKSLGVSVFWPAWEWGPRGLASKRYLTSSYSDRNVVRDTTKMAKLVESEKYQALYGDTVRPTQKWGEHKLVNSATGEREGRAFASMTGGRGDRVIIDDPHSVDTAESDAERASTVNTFRTAIPDRLNDMTKSAIVVIMQRLHVDDVAGTILKLRLPYVHLNLPMEFESYRLEDGVKVDARCRTYRKDGTLLFEDPRRQDGELLFPERFPRGVVEGLKHVKGSYAYAGQYQQRPTAREGGLFKREWFVGKIVPANRLPDTIRKRVRGWDFAGTEPAPGASPDWTATARIARNGPDFYIEHVTRFQTTPGAVRKQVISYAETDPRYTTVRIPKDPGQAGIDQADQYIQALAGFTVKAVRPTGSKVVRAEPLSIQAEGGHVYLVEGAWNDGFLDRLCSFPNGPDDEVDAAADAFNELAPGVDRRFEAQTAGRSSVVDQVSRDSRYQFEDKDPDLGRGWGSASANRGNGLEYGT